MWSCNCFDIQIIGIILAHSMRMYLCVFMEYLLQTATRMNTTSEKRLSLYRGLVYFMCVYIYMYNELILF